MRLPHVLRDEAAGAVVLLAAAVLAVVIANSPLAALYFETLHRPVGGRSVLHWINDGLMALFFLLVGLEVKREFIAGHLSSWRRRVLPGAAALAGMVVPAAIYLAVNAAQPAYHRGWAIPTATDIAFALGILALAGSRVPASLKILLTAIAVIDDLLAILVIALVYTQQITVWPLLGAGAGLVVLVILNRAGVRSLVPYLLIGVGIWYGVLASGVHATLAGVAVALTIPLGGRRSGAPDTVGVDPTGGTIGDHDTPLDRLVHRLHPWSAFVIVPVFGFANAGVAFGGLSAQVIVSSLPLGIMLGLFVGKQLGIFGMIWGLVRLGLAEAPSGASWRQIHAMSVLCGIGFTMSLFIGGLAFADGSHALSDAVPDTADAVKVGVFVGSLLAGTLGWALLRRHAARVGPVEAH